MILKRIILPWQPWALWLIKGVPRWRSQMILSGRSEKDGRTGTVCRITTFKSPPIMSVLVLGLKLESMNVNTSNCIGSTNLTLKTITFPRKFKAQRKWRQSSFLGCRWPQVFFSNPFSKKRSDHESQESGFGFDPLNPSWVWIQWIQNPFSDFSKETQNKDLDSPQEAHSYFFDSMFQCFAKRIRLSEKVLVRLPMPDCNTFVSYFRVFQMSVIPRVFGQQLWNLAVLLI